MTIDITGEMPSESLNSSMKPSGGFSADYKVGFIYIGPPGDHGWNYQHDVGRKAVDEAFGGKVETVFQENVPESADAERVMTQMALAGADMIFATSFGYMAVSYTHLTLPTICSV